jgi:uncharacterized protein YjbI with pentapeptide repeats
LHEKLNPEFKFVKLLMEGSRPPVKIENDANYRSSSRRCRIMSKWKKELVDRNLSTRNLSGARLSRANLTQADLSGANLMGADCLASAKSGPLELEKIRDNFCEIFFKSATLSRQNLITNLNEPSQLARRISNLTLH